MTSKIHLEFVHSVESASVALAEAADRNEDEWTHAGVSRGAARAMELLGVESAYRSRVPTNGTVASGRVALEESKQGRRVGHANSHRGVAATPTFWTKPYGAGAFPVPTTSTEEQRCEEYCTDRSGLTHSVCASLWPDLNFESPSYSSDDYALLGKPIVQIQRIGAEPGKATKRLIRQAFGILWVHLDLVEWAACCVEGEIGPLSLRRFVRAKLTGHGETLTGEKKSIVQVINSDSEIPGDDEHFRRELSGRLPGSYDEFVREVRTLIASEDTPARVYIYPETCFWETWRQIQNRHHDAVNGEWSLRLAAIFLHEMAHQYARMLEKRGYTDLDAYFHESGSHCDVALRLENTFLWAMYQRFPEGGLFSDESYGENSCADGARISVNSSSLVGPADAYNLESNGGFVLTDVTDCLESHGWTFGSLSTFPCEFGAPSTSS